MSKIHGNIVAPFGFFTPFPHRPSQHISEGQWGENRLKAERAWFLTEEVRRVEPETEPLLTRWGKSGVFSESTVLSFLKHTRRPNSSASLEERFGKAKSSDVAPAISLSFRLSSVYFYYTYNLEEIYKL